MAASLLEELRNSISIPQAAELLGVGRATAWRYCKVGIRGVRLRAIRRGNLCVTTRENVERFLRELNEDRAPEFEDSDAVRRGRDSEDALERLGC